MVFILGKRNKIIMGENHCEISQQWQLNISDQGLRFVSRTGETLHFISTSMSILLDAYISYVEVTNTSVKTAD